MTIDFEEHRGHLRGVAYRMLGSLAEADDAVQEAWLRLERARPDEVANPRGWLTTVVARIALDMLRTRASRREDALEQGGERVAAGDPEQDRMLADAVGLALLVVLDKLDPAERIAFVLHDLCGVGFDEIAAIVGRSPDAARQLASRARRRVQGSPPPEAELAGQREVIARFVAALRQGDLAGLLAILDPEVVVVHGAGEIRGAERAARNWVEGAAAFARFADLFTIMLVDDAVGLVMAPKGRPVRALRFSFAGDRIARAEIIAEPARLAALALAPLATSAPAG